MISQCEKYVELEDKAKKKYCIKALKKIIERRREIKQIQYSYQIILLEIQFRDIYLQLLIILVSLDMQN